jgi:mRNA-degrading endonuclease YafQ of YafQ-DinJ toxin-antitoxin module
VKYRTTGSFDRDFARLPTEHQQMFLKVLREHFLPAIGAGSFTGVPPWPKRLRVHQLVGGVYSITWNFTGPDGRATFGLDRDQNGDTVLVWRRIGTHDIYDRP